MKQQGTENRDRFLEDCRRLNDQSRVNVELLACREPALIISESRDKQQGECSSMTGSLSSGWPKVGRAIVRRS